MYAYCRPICPCCGTAMDFGRRVPAFNAQPELQNFECRPCGVIFTQAATAPGRIDFCAREIGRPRQLR